MAKIKTAIEDFKPDLRLVDERGATRERLRKSPYEAGDMGVVTVKACPLERALRKKIKRMRGGKEIEETLIDKDQYDAGIKFRHHWYHSGFSPKIGSIDLNRVFGNPSNDTASERQIFHRQQYERACKHVGLRTEKILADVICWESPLDEIGMAQLGIGNRPQAEAAVRALFINGLDMLVDLWGLRTK